MIGKVLSALFRAGGSIGFMFLGQFLIPIPALGAIVGAVGGSGVGHFSARLLTKVGLTKLLADRIENY